MKILQIVDAYNPGLFGVPEEYGQQLAKYHSVSILGGNFFNNIYKEFEFKNMKISLFPLKKSFFFRLFLNLKYFFLFRKKIKNYDLIFLHHPLSAFLYNIILKKRHHKIIYFFHSPWLEEYLIEIEQKKGIKFKINCLYRKYIEYFSLKRSDYVITLSKFMHKKLIQHHNIKSKIIKGGIDTEFFKPYISKKQSREKNNLPVDKKILFTVRRFVKRMGLENLIDAYAKLVKETEEYKNNTILIIAGTGYLEEKLKIKVKEYQLEGNIIFPGKLTEEQLRDYYIASDLFILPTKELEGFGLVLLEALSCATICLSTKCGGPEEILSDLMEFLKLNKIKIYNLLFDSKDSIGIYSGIKQALEIENIENLKELLSEFVKKYYNLEHTVEKINSLIYGEENK